LINLWYHWIERRFRLILHYQLSKYCLPYSREDYYWETYISLEYVITFYLHNFYYFIYIKYLTNYFSSYFNIRVRFVSITQLHVCMKIKF
jgi:hypothetical protein